MVSRTTTNTTAWMKFAALGTAEEAKKISTGALSDLEKV